MTGKTHSDLDLSMLTDEEREGLLDDTVIDEGLEDDGGEGGEGAGDTGQDAGDGAENGAESGSDAGDGDGAGAGDDNAQAAGADPAAVAGSPASAVSDVGADAGDAGDGAADTVTDEEVERPASWILPGDINDKIKNLDEERDRIAASFDDGDLTAQEMRAKLKPIEQELDALKDRRTAANVSRDLAIETYRTQTVPAFFKDHPQYEKGTVLYDMLDTELKKLQSVSLDPLNPKHLQKAHAIIDGQLRKALGDGAVGKKDAGTTKTLAGKTPAPKREIPPTLANVPSADITDAEDGGEFAYLDRLANKDVEAYERELGKLSDDKRDRYLAQ